MKKSIALVALAFGVTGAFAQDLTSKKGEPFLPEAGDYGISVDATPFLNYAGNFFGKSANNTAPTWNFLNGNNTIVGKYFKDANTAYRVGLRLGFGSTTTKSMVDNRGDDPATGSYPDAQTMVENKWKAGKTNVGITVGLEKRRGKTRLQGIYGADLGIWVGSSKDKFTYGNALVVNSTSGTAPNVGVSGADAFSGANNVVANPGIVGMDAGTSARITTRKNGMTLSVGVRAFIGAEYFVAPKVSIGGEFGWGLGYTMTGASKTTYESTGVSTGATQNSIGTTEIKGDKSSSFGLDTDNKNGVFGPSAALRLNFHF
mgnify:CR=1 FL=1